MPEAGSICMKFNSVAGVLKILLLVIAFVGIVFWVFGFISTKNASQPYQSNGVAPSTSSSENLPELSDGIENQSKPVAAVHVSAMHPSAKIQVAILLDVSNSMDGLIEQAKAQLWNMVSIMGQVRCQGLTPAFELALYEYGRPENQESKGYIRQLHDFTSNLDKVSSTLFSINTNGGDEYSPQVISQSSDELLWDDGSQTYKVIFIAGNEDFNQGPIRWDKACKITRQKDIVVNTIYCGPRQTGIEEGWNLGAECGNGRFTNINQNAIIEDIPTPYDSVLFALNAKLNTTYIAFGANGSAAALMQADVDQKNYTMNKSAAAKRIEVKGKKELYKNEEWDLVDAVESKKTSISSLNKETLPDSLQKKSTKELEKFISEKAKERTLIQSQIGEIAAKRNQFLLEDKKHRSAGDATLQTEIEKIIREQVRRFRMEVER